MNFSKKIWHILTPRQRRNTAILLSMMLISMLLETFGIGLVIPAMILLTQNNLADKYPFIKPWLHLLGNPSYENLIIIGMSILIGIYVIKTFFLVFLAWSQGKFLFGVQVSLSERLYAGYLQQPYIFHTQQNSAQLIRNVVTETELFAFKTILPGMTIMTELLVMSGITVLLLYVEPLGAILVAAILGIAGIIFHTFTRKPLLRWGEGRQLHDALRLQQLQQGLGGVKEVKLFGREEEFLAQYNVQNVRRVLMSRWENLLQTLPRLYLELLAVSSLAALILAMIVQHKSVASFMPALGLFAAAAFRLMPAANRILGAVQNVKYSLPIVNTLYSELIQIEKPVITVKKPASLFAHQLTLSNISYRYNNAPADAIEQVSLTINKGTSIGVIGESGAGKSTLIDLILGLLKPSRGQIEMDGVDIQFNIRAWQDQIGYVSQSIYLSDDTIRRNIAFGLANEQIEEEMVQRAIKLARLDTFIATLPKGLDTLVGERGVRLSGGQRQRIGIARALYHNPAVLVLDEATSSLDTGTEDEVMREVHELQDGRTLIIVAHRMSAVKRCDRLIHFDRGKIVEEIKSFNTTDVKFATIFQKTHPQAET